MADHDTEIIEKRKRKEMKRFKYISILAAFAAIFASCTSYDEPVFTSGGSGDGMVRARVTLATPDFNVIESRNKDILDEKDEYRWTHVYVAQFDENEQLVGTPRYYTNADISSNPVELQAMANTTVYFVTNADYNPFYVDGTTDWVADIDEFSQNVYNPTVTLPGDNLTGDNDLLVMVGAWTGELEADNPALSDILVYVERIAAKIDVTIIADQSVFGNGLQGAWLKMDSARFCALPKSTSFVRGVNKTLTASQVGDLLTETLTLSNDSDGNDWIYRMPTIYAVDNYPGNLGEGKDNTKNNFAPKDGDQYTAGYIKIFGSMDDLANIGPVSYTIFLGNDPHTNFNIERNAHYHITIRINGAGLVTTDIRVDNKQLSTIHLRKLNNSRATSRYSENREMRGDSAIWGDVVNAEGVSLPSVVAAKYSNSLDFVKVYTGAGDDTWGFNIDLVPAPESNDRAWSDFRLEYSLDGITWETPSASAEGSVVVNGVVTSAKNLPNGARIRLNLGPNPLATTRTANLEFWNDQYNEKIGEVFSRKWSVYQTANPGFNLPEFTYFPSEAGIYAVPVRALATHWKLRSKLNDTNFEVLGVYRTVEIDGVTVPQLVADPYETYIPGGHGTVIVRAKNTNTETLPYVTSNLTFDINLDGNVSTRSVRLCQIAPTSAFVTSMSSTSRYVVRYSSSPLFESLVPALFSSYWGVNLLDRNKNFYDNESWAGATSSTDGKYNTAMAFSAMDKWVRNVIPDDATLAADLGDKGVTKLDAYPVITPAGICTLLNAEDNPDWQDISAANKDDLTWYMPARYEGLLDATASMMGFVNMGANLAHNQSFWTSTTLTSYGADPKPSAYFAGTSVDVSGTYGNIARIRCIRDLDVAAETITYPYVKRVNDRPVIVIREGDEGFNETYSGTVYNVGVPLRFSSKATGFTPDGTGPTDKIYNRSGKASPAFQVALEDADIMNITYDESENPPLKVETLKKTGIWQYAVGWNDAADDFSQYETGCAAYTERDKNGNLETGWRAPTEIELRLMGLLGAVAENDNIPVFLTGGERFSNFTGFKRMSGNYWGAREWQDTDKETGIISYNRASYVGIAPAGLTGTAHQKATTSYRIRCVKDISL